MRTARKKHGVRSVGADAELCAVCQFTGDREQGRGAVDTDIDVVGLAASGVARDDGRTLNVHPAARFDVDTAAEIAMVGRNNTALDIHRTSFRTAADVDTAAGLVVTAAAHNIAATYVQRSVVHVDNMFDAGALEYTAL